MQDNMDRHFPGVFNFNGKEIAGSLIYNKESGAILLNLITEVKVTDVFPIGRSHVLDTITGVLHSGVIVTLFHNRLLGNYPQLSRTGLTQQLVFVADYAIRSEGDATNVKYNKLECVLENALNWSGLSTIESTIDTRIGTSDFLTIKIKKIDNKNEYHWFGAKITFSLKCELFSLPHKEESKVVERLRVSIESDEKLDASNFISIRNKIISLISFAIKNNVNIDEQVLYDFEHSHQIGPNTEYLKYHLYTSEPRLIIYESNPWNYNFNLCQLSPEKDIQKDKLTRLEPIFNLYLSQFKYKDMPPEMVFLNIVQALETFHTRFFYHDRKDEYVAYVKKHFGSPPNNPVIKKLLLNDTQKNCKRIILVSRLNDLLIRKYDKLFIEYYSSDASFAQTVVNTRNYYTHYDSSKEKKALKDDKLIDARRILSRLLEYSVCSQLGIDNQEKVREVLMREELSSISRICS